MKAPFEYTSTYTLDKSHFSETYDESVELDTSIKPYMKPLGFIAFGFAILYFTELNSYLAWFIIVLGIVDALSVYYKKPWWLARQLISRSAKQEVKITIDDTGIHCHSLSFQSKIEWTELDSIKKTNKGWLLHRGPHKTYLSGRCLNDEANAFIREKMLAKTE